MAREYPRFLFSNPLDTKSEGPFVTATDDPIFICKASFAKPGEQGYGHLYHWAVSGAVKVEFVFISGQPNPKDKEAPKKLVERLGAMADWLRAQYEQGKTGDWKLK